MRWISWPADAVAEARLDGLRQREAKALSWHLAGVTTVADWVGSNAAWFYHSGNANAGRIP